MEDKRMSDQNPYTRLDLPEDASFEEIQNARDRLIERDEQNRQDIEAAYDAILMDRLRKASRRQDLRSPRAFVFQSSWRKSLHGSRCLVPQSLQPGCKIFWISQRCQKS